MLPKRSTPVDQNFLSENTHSQLSVTIFRTSRNLLGTQKSLSVYTKKKSQNYETHKPPPLWLHFGAISRNVLTSQRGLYGFSNFKVV